MRFLRKNKIDKTILVLSDLHLGAGPHVDGKPNVLEDFHYDEELVDFLIYFSTGEFVQRDVELIINGDFFDLLAVPFIPFYDDDYWSEEAALHKLKIITKAHEEVMNAITNFCSIKNKKIIYIIGNHDGECILQSLRDHLMSFIEDKNRDSFNIISPENGEYTPYKGIVVKHGHEYEIANKFIPSNSIIEDNEGKRYFLPPWGSYYVVRVINKFKEQRDHINAVRPIKRFLINGMIYDTLYTLRFIFANAFYFVFVRFIVFFKQGHKMKDVLAHAISELELFRDYESMTEDYFEENPETKLLIMGHTHSPSYKIYAGGEIFLNTGTWTDMYYIGFENKGQGSNLTFANIEIYKDSFDSSLYSWKGKNDRPYADFF
jgi:UDP-2,3-diacylglucosamine pyrophosphatase LpxH